MDRATPVLETISQLKHNIETYTQDPQGKNMILCITQYLILFGVLNRMVGCCTLCRTYILWYI